MIFQTFFLVTGGAGNIGGSLCRRLVEDPTNFVVIVDNLSTGSKSKLPSPNACNWKFYQADVNNLAELAPIFSNYSFNFVFHYAAVVGVNRTQSNPLSVLRDIEGIKNILELSRAQSVTRVIYASSSEVYGEPVEIPQNELTTPLNSRLPYAVVKNIGECFLRSYNQQYGLSYTIFRFFNTYGPLQSTDFVVSKFISSALTDSPISIYGDGSQARTFCYISDNIDFTLQAIKDQSCLNRIINVGNAEVLTINMLADIVIKTLDSKSIVHYLPPLPSGDMMRRQPDNSLMLSILDRNLIPIDRGILNIAQHWRVNIDDS